MRKFTAVALTALLAACSSTGLVPDDPIECSSCEAWNVPHPPVQIAEKTWYVGTAGLSSILIDTGEGLILLDGALPQSAPLIAGNIESLVGRSHGGEPVGDEDRDPILVELLQHCEQVGQRRKIRNTRLARFPSSKTSR